MEADIYVLGGNKEAHSVHEEDCIVDEVEEESQYLCNDTPFLLVEASDVEDYVDCHAAEAAEADHGWSIA